MLRESSRHFVMCACNKFSEMLAVSFKVSVRVSKSVCGTKASSETVKLNLEFKIVFQEMVGMGFWEHQEERYRDFFARLVCRERIWLPAIRNRS